MLHSGQLIDPPSSQRVLIHPYCWDSAEKIEIHIFLFFLWFSSLRLGCGRCATAAASRCCSRIGRRECRRVREKLLDILNFLESEVDIGYECCHVPECIAEHMWEPCLSRDTKFTTERSHV